MPSDPDTFPKLGRHFDLIISTVSAVMDGKQYPDLLNIGGHRIVVGLPGGDIPIAAFSLTSGRRSLARSQIGGMGETQEMLHF